MVRKRKIPKRKCLILFNSYLYTVKSIYRRRLTDGNYIVYLRFNQPSEPVVARVKNISLVAGIKKGDLVTVHLGNGGYVIIEKGDKVPKDGKILSCKV